MNEIVVSDYQELSDRAAALVVDRINKNPNLVLGLATGSTPIGLYKKLVKEHKKGKINFKQITSFNLDEYCGLENSHEQSYRYFMDENLFNHIDINLFNVFFPACDQEEGWYDKTIQEAGGIDLQILGIGRNGHIGFNEPGSPFNSQTRIIKLAESTREDNARFFNDPKEVPRQAITMGLKTIMEAREILLLASGKNKKEAVHKLLNKKASVDLPASVLQNHPNVTIILDKQAG